MLFRSVEIITVLVILLIVVAVIVYLKLSLAVTLEQGVKVQKKRMFAQEYKLAECFRDGPAVRLHIDSGAKISFKIEAGKQIKIGELCKNQPEKPVSPNDKLVVQKGDGLKFKVTEGNNSWTLSIRK